MHRAWLLLLLTELAGFAQPTRPVYVIHRTPSPITIDAKLDEPAWRNAPEAGEFYFNWWKEGEKERTAARLLWDADNLYVSYR
ncbi:MAG TPA: hypothetical protein VLE22_24490, partial [Bryobacteraceae bacterium]|nr:hypothetical protein [Bryobacteraceae bacterium]